MACVGTSSVFPLSGTSAIETTGWTVLFPPMVMVSICCCSLDATWFLAILFVSKMAVSSAQICNQMSKSKSKKKPVTACTTIPRTMEKFRVRNGIVLTMNPGEQMGWLIVDAGPMTRTQISEVTIVRAVMPLEKTRKILVDFVILSSCSKKAPVIKSTLRKRDPGSVVCANNANNTTFTVIRIRRLFKTNLNRFSCSSWLN